MFMCSYNDAGFLNISQALRYIRPPDSLITQLDIYTEEKFEDEEDMRERSLSKHQTSADSEIGLRELVQAAKQDDGLLTATTEALSHLQRVLESDFETLVFFNV